MELTIDVSVIALVITVLLNIGGSIWWAASINTRLSHIEAELNEQKSLDAKPFLKAKLLRLSAA